MRYELWVTQALTWVICYALYRLLMRFSLFRREMKKFIRLSKQGPFYRLGARLLTKLMRLALGSRAYVAPSSAPKATLVKRATDSVTVTWRCRTTSREYHQIMRIPAQMLHSTGWLEDELQVRAHVNSEPVTVDVDQSMSTARNVKPGATLTFSARAVNPKGVSPWSKELSVETLQKPSEYGGGWGPNYTWKQTAKAIQLSCDVPVGTRGRDVSVKFGSHSISVRVNQDVVFDKAPLFKAIQPDECCWEITPGPSPRLLLTLDKLERTQFDGHWSSVIDGHPAIDTRLLASQSLPKTFD